VSAPALIRGSGGIRKVRWAAQGKGKRGGLRVIYYWITHRGHSLLLTLYRKSEVSDLTPGEVRALRALVENLEVRGSNTPPIQVSILECSSSSGSAKAARNRA
jgi:hypothetical protein